MYTQKSSANLTLIHQVQFFIPYIPEIDHNFNVIQL